MSLKRREDWPRTSGPLPSYLPEGDGRQRAPEGIDARRAIALEMQVEALTAANAVLAAELAEARALLPPRPPKGWVCVKRAADLAGCSDQAVYKWARAGAILSTKIAGRIYINPASLKTCI